MLSPLAPIHLAILDDHTLFRQGVVQLLRQLPFVTSVQEAATFPELLAAMAHQLPDVLLLDLQMPEMDGMEATKRLLNQYPGLKIIVLSMHSADHFVYHLLKLGARSYLPKDTSQDQLREAIEAVLADGHYFTNSMSRAMVRGLQSASRHKPSLQLPALVLTPREMEVLTLLGQGLTTNEIAQRLFISSRTVEGHRKNLLEKSNTHNSISLVLFAVKHGLLELGVGEALLK